MLLARSLTPTQRLVLRTLVLLCDEPGRETRYGELARVSALDLRTVVLSLRSLERRALCECDGAGEERTARPTWNGRDVARAFAPPRPARDDAPPPVAPD